MAAKTSVPDDLQRLIRYLPESDQEERDRAGEAARSFVDGLPAGALASLPPLTRSRLWLTAHRRWDEAVALVRFERDNPGAFHVRGLLSPVLEVPGVAPGVLPKEVAGLSDKEIPLVTRLTEMVWENGVLVLRGYAHVLNVPVPGRPRLPVLAWLTRKGSRKRVPLKTVHRREPLATLHSKQGLHCYDGSGFEIVVDPARLRSGAGWEPGTWSLTLAVWAFGRARRGGLAAGEVGTAGHAHARGLDDRTLWVSGFTKKRLEFRVEPLRAELRGHRREGDDLVLDLSAPVDRLVVSRTEDGTEVETEHPVDGTSARVPLDALRVSTGATRELRVRTVTGRDRSPVTVLDGSVTGAHPVGDDREISVGASAEGRLVLHDRVRQPVVEALRWEQGMLHLSGTYTGPSRDRVLVLRHGERFEEIRVPVTIGDGRFEAVIDPDHQDFFGALLPLRQGRWYLSLRAADRWDHHEDVPVKISPALIGSLPLRHAGKHRGYTVDRRFHDRVFLAPDSMLTLEEKGAYRQRLLREEYLRARREEPLREAVLYTSFTGSQFSDSPRAVYEELARRGVDVEHVWTVRDGQVALPEGVTGVDYSSREWYEALARYRYIVTNVKMPDWFLRREGQTVVQTWHGTPLKKIGADLLGTPKANRAYIANLPHMSRQWDFLVSPNTFSTPIMRNAFSCEAEILESGYPRNDVFHAPDRDVRAKRVRQALGLPEGKRVVLYAPTWRDDQRYGGKRFKLDLQIDLPALREELGEDYVLLFRKHPKVLDSIPGAGQGFVWDVTKYPDIADLYLIADVLVTDYSSAFFDFAHSGRPMLFYTYDLEHYRDTLRGFYFDLGEKAPGPLLKTSEELIAALKDLDGIVEEYRERYEEFVRDFCDPSDGRATVRVVDRMLNGRG